MKEQAIVEETKNGGDINFVEAWKVIEMRAIGNRDNSIFKSIMILAGKWIEFRGYLYGDGKVVEKDLENREVADNIAFARQRQNLDKHYVVKSYKKFIKAREVTI